MTAPVVRRRINVQAAAARGAAAQPPKPPKEPTTTNHKGSGYMRHEYTRGSGKNKAVVDSGETQNPVLEDTFTEDDPPAFVRMSAGFTYNMGNYESLRLDCSVTIPVHRSKIDEGIAFCGDYVSEKMQEEEQKWLGSKDRARGK